MWPDRVSNPGPLTYESGALPTALRDPATIHCTSIQRNSTLHQGDSMKCERKYKQIDCFASDIRLVPSLKSFPPLDLLLLLHCCFTSTVNN